MKRPVSYVYLRSDQPLDIKKFRPLLIDVLGRDVELQFIQTNVWVFPITENDIESLQTFLSTYLQEHQGRLHGLITYRLHGLGEMASKLGLKRNQGKIEHLSDLMLQLMIENHWDLLPLIQEEFNKVPRHLMLTAMMLITCDMNATKASEKLYIHRNTFAYRLNQFIQLTGLDIRRHRYALFFTLITKQLMFKQ
jgi:hypothetical protein